MTCGVSLSLPTQTTMASGFGKSLCRLFPRSNTPFYSGTKLGPKSKTKGRSLGIEHASFEDLEKALAGVRGYYDDENNFDITKSDLMRLGLLMGSDSRKRREYLGESSASAIATASNCSNA
jgi:ribonuclease M5